MANDEAIGAALELYVEYDYLPVEQGAKLFGAVAEIHDILGAEQVAPGFSAWMSPPLFAPGFRLWAPAPLCFQSIQTGDSITVRFAPPGRWLPRVSVEGGDVELLLPRWTAVMILTGAALTHGLDGYQQFLNAQKTRLEIQKAQLEIEKLRSELHAMPKPSQNAAGRIELHVNEFNYYLAQPNIRSATLNGIPLGQMPSEPRPQTRRKQ